MTPPSEPTASRESFNSTLIRRFAGALSVKTAKLQAVFLEAVRKSSARRCRRSLSAHFISPPHFMFPILESPAHPRTLLCHSTLLNCPSNGKDGSVEMERIEKRRGGNQ